MRTRIRTAFVLLVLAAIVATVARTITREPEQLILLTFSSTGPARFEWAVTGQPRRLVDVNGVDVRRQTRAKAGMSVAVVGWPLGGGIEVACSLQVRGAGPPVRDGPRASQVVCQTTIV